MIFFVIIFHNITILIVFIFFYQIKAALVRALYTSFTDPKHLNGSAHYDFCSYSFLLVCVGNFFELECLDFASKISQSNSKCDRTFRRQPM